ncbi:hypothetical protein BDM02DRAFT_3188760 [Thelephora ganbajun]|uniref:Uncharacterized protein n=1 Tax=Thelephora ganbajun TaxID=370292 RepID=A0ACB6ZA14_THEGA|nr:hypothetical protein BDM02DRAFT_3188760 [Thelephora ganbajun]
MPKDTGCMVAKQVDEYLLHGVEMDEDTSHTGLGLTGEEAEGFHEMEKDILGIAQGEEDKKPFHSIGVPCTLPMMDSTVTTRLMVTETTELEEIVEAAHCSLGCTSVKWKPILTWKLTTDKRKLKSLKEVEIVIGLVAESQYLASLRDYFEQKSQPEVSKSKSKKKKPAPLLLNLDADEGEDEYLLQGEEGGDTMTEQEALYHDALTKEYTRCEHCGYDVPCKVNRFGLHHHLSWLQLNAWATALAANSPGVTLCNPPQAPLFDEFHPSLIHPSSSALPQPIANLISPPQAPPILDSKYATLSIEDFLCMIEQKDSQRDVKKYISSFTEKGYFDLSEIFYMDSKTLEASVNMPEGTAWLVQKTMDEYWQK